MENTMNSTRKAISYSERTSDLESQEESGWTMYFEDFFNNKNNNEESSFSFEDHDHCCTESSSLVLSDAASSVTKRFACNDLQDVVGMPIMEKRSFSRSLSFKKRKIDEGGLVDDALEDTASSPANSPKVCSMMNKLKNPREKYHSLKSYNDQEKGSNSRNSDVSCTELKKRGLCLVPLSMVLNHLG
ncbi:hypothetical protein HS088_TW19G00162 [Tripterygium wilfordii]|uniref:Uncharacterized protein n=1 Tax=Tripterygium wilfordii TaxID=458696 RepID=A0A7J7C8Z3_TRIWF|nr:vascular-related unknown protein 4-like isoform X1 [Tripterygium wilfordii]KAF5730570.1 hypothetical protein HS088_TW19G00162 [Tripterygium wilfordii]